VSVESTLERLPWAWGRDVALRRWRSRAHRGDAVTCPLCERSFDDWDPGGRCWWCEGGPRERTVWSVLADRPRLLSPDMSILHFDPGWGLQARVASRSGFEYVTAGEDPAVNNLELDVAAIDLADGTYDGVIAPFAVHRRPDGERALAELRRVLEPDGWMLLVAEPGDDPSGALRAAGFVPERAGETAWLGRARR
jgi:SAM-dependent methyltransferase